MSFVPLFLFVWLGLAPPGASGDWPQFLGPTRNGVYDGPPLVASDKPSEPLVLWRRPVGQGYAGPAVVGSKLILFHRVGDEEVVECIDRRTGITFWKSSYPTAYRDSFGFDEGPRATPTIAGEYVYTYGAEGTLSCWQLKDGTRVWQVRCQERWRIPPSFFGAATSPLVVGDLLLLNVGGRPNAGIVAFDRKTGKVKWTATDHEASYSSPVSARVGGRLLAFFFTREGFVALRPESGTIVHQLHWRSRFNASVNAATPLVVGNRVFLSACYGTGATVLELSEQGLKQLWQSDESLSNHYATSIYYRGYLYGFHGRQEYGPELRCVRFDTGEVMWSQGGLGAGTVLRAGEVLVVTSERGDVWLAALTPEAWRPLLRFRPLGPTVRAYPALAHGCMFLRNNEELVALRFSDELVQRAD